MPKPTGRARQESPDSQQWLEGYRPRSVDRTDWEKVRPFVTAWVSQLGEIELGRLGRLLGLLARLAVWADRQSLPLDPEVVLDPDMVERFVTETVPHDRSASTYRSDLRRIGIALTRKAPWESQPAGLARREVADPYTSIELEQLKVDALAQATRLRRRAARAVLALGAGAGLDGRWVGRVAGGDVVKVGTAVLVKVGERSAREVPVLATWEEEVLDLATSAGTQFLIGGRSLAPNRVSDLIYRLEVPRDHPKLSPARLRSTWLVTHLTMGTRLPELARAAGLRGVFVLSDLLPHVAPFDDESAIEMLRGRS